MRLKFYGRMIALTAVMACGTAMTAPAPVPAIVNRGRPPEITACAACHLPNGAGRLENAALAGETVGYFKQQITNLKSGDRNGSGGDAQKTMIQIAKTLTPAEADAAAAYFSKLPAVSFVKVRESATAPKTVVDRGVLVKAPDGATEPTGNRIVEVSDDSARAANHDPDVTYTAYVPPGSLMKGKELATSETGDKTIACKECHGDDLKGDGDLVPWIAGRSPSYILRQLTNIKNKTRAGSSVPMQMVVEKLTPDDMVAIAAYVATLRP